MTKKININISITTMTFIGSSMILSAIVFMAILLFLNKEFLEAYLIIIGTLITSGSGIICYDKCKCKKNEKF